MREAPQLLSQTKCHAVNESRVRLHEGIALVKQLIEEPYGDSHSGGGPALKASRNSLGTFARVPDNIHVRAEQLLQLYGKRGGALALVELKPGVSDDARR